MTRDEHAGPPGQAAAEKSAPGRAPDGGEGPAAGQGEEVRPAAEALVDLIRFALRQMTPLREIGFSAMAALNILDSMGPHRVTELAVHEGISQPSMTAMVSRLEQQGLVARAPDPDDGRSVLVNITDRGREMVRRRRSGQVTFLSHLIGELEPAARGQLTDAAAALARLTDTDQVPGALEAAREAMAREAAREGGGPGEDWNASAGSPG
ncbi:MarR family winged helix-turn-helix transcriptional regulator [Streptomyces sp. NPDC059740]|uniref:MarR family winged helix-turn-helix transcriptional regulator n=1 Tax=Streptomyces sp. NPDC059740 TaxID=3346926 RepID=UPI00364E5D6B